MTDQQHPITPPPHDQVYKWWEEARKKPPSSFYEKLDYVAAKAAEWGADQELEACSDWVEYECPGYGGPHEKLRAARRPKPWSLAEEALQAIAAIKASDGDYRQFEQDIDSICAALERLQELENGND